MLSDSVLVGWITELDLSSYPASWEVFTIKLKCVLKTSLSRPQSRFATPLEAAKPTYSKSGSEVMLEELYQDFLFCIM